MLEYSLEYWGSGEADLHSSAMVEGEGGCPEYVLLAMLLAIYGDELILAKC